MVSEDGVADPMTMGVPRGWADFAKVPSTGTFSCKYVTGPRWAMLGHAEFITHFRRIDSIYG